jgi:FtsP/CotA-like multicopper oxidase with cupredoxin domain
MGGYADRRQFSAAASAVALRIGAHALVPHFAGGAQSVAMGDFTLHIAPVSVELAPGKIAKTVGYPGKRYRLSFRNESGDTHPLHFHRRSFEITNFAGKLPGGVHKDVVVVNPFSTVEADFVADNPGLILFHCHAQLHMDVGFMNLIKYT